MIYFQKKPATCSLILLLLVLLATSVIPAWAAAPVHPKEYRAFWFSFYDYSKYREENKERNAATFESYFSKVVKNGKDLGMNTIIVHVRPFGDAIYKSSCFPWSACISGKQGTDPGFDPLEIMVKVAHNEGLRIEAWINPYRLTSNTTDYSSLSQDNQAFKWHKDKKTERNVLAYGGKLYFNPSQQDVRNLIVKGVEEIVKNYNVDGIHMDDYFYPSFSKSNVLSAFDAPEYKKSNFKKEGKTIEDYRRTQVNLLVKQIHDAVKAAKPNATFGISPAGDPEELSSGVAHYVDYRTWLRSNAYIDYICPQIYWGFNHSNCQFDKITDKWSAAAKGSPVRLYIGIAVYKAGNRVGTNNKEKNEWKNDAMVLKKQIIYGRSRGAKGFAFFDYSDLIRPGSRRAVETMKPELMK